MLENLSPQSLILGPRPGKKSFERLSQLNLTHCCTLLGEKETPSAIKKISARLGCEWLWLPIDGGGLETLQAVDIESHVRTLNSALDGVPNPVVYLHCSAGIHRTGFFAYLLLRVKGEAPDQAVATLEKLRTVTAQQVGEERIALAEEMLRNSTLNINTESTS